MDNRTQLRLKAALEEIQSGTKEILTLLDEFALPAPEPPINITDGLRWNLKSPWPFPTRGKSASALLARVKYITIHHSAGKRETTSISWWNHHHTRNKNWPHVGYHFGIAAFDKQDNQIDLYQLNRIGEHTWHDSRNFDTLGVCIAGDLRAGKDTEPTPRQVELAARLLAWLVPQLPNFVGVTFHKRIQATACPGDINRWGAQIINETKTYGLDLSKQWGVKPGRAVRGRLRGVLRKEPLVSSYEDV